MLQKFAPFYIHTPAFVELPRLALSAINAFIIKHPHVKYPSGFSRLVALTAQVDEHIAAQATKGESTPILFLFAQFLTLYLLFLRDHSRNEQTTR